MGKKHKSFFKKFINNLLIIVCLLIIMILVYPFSMTFSKPKAGNFNHIIKEGLENNQDTLVTKIAMLGAHDAFSNKISLTSKVDPAEDSIVSTPVINKVIKGMIVREAKSQKSGSEQLLNSGVRYFDIRLSYMDNTWYTKHSLISDKLSTYLIPMIKFLSDNPGELVILDIQHCYYGNTDYNGLIEDLKNIKYEGKNIFDFLNYIPLITPLELLTYRLATLNGSKSGIVMLVKNETTAYTYNYEKSIRSNWHNKITDDEMFKGIEEENDYLKKHKLENIGKFKVNQAQKTGQINSQILSTIIGWSLLDLANNFNEKLINHENFDDWLNQMPIVMVDYADSTKGNFNKLINQKLLKYNQNL